MWSAITWHIQDGLVGHVITFRACWYAWAVHHCLIIHHLFEDIEEKITVIAAMETLNENTDNSKVSCIAAYVHSL